MRRAAFAIPSAFYEFFDPHPFQGVDQLLQSWRQRPNLLLQFRDQFVLHYSPALQYSNSLRNIHGGRSM